MDPLYFTKKEKNVESNDGEGDGEITEDNCEKEAGNDAEG